MIHFEFGWQTADGLNIYAQGWEPKQEPKAVVCVVHGLGEHGGRYIKIAEPLANVGYAVLAFDQRGFGKSQGKRGHAPGYEQLLDDLEQFLEQAAVRFPGKQLVLYGHSMGGNLVLNYGLRRQKSLAGIIATSPWLRLAFEPPAVKIFLAKILDKIYPSFTQPNGLHAPALTQDEDVVETYIHDPLVHERISVRLFTSVNSAGVWALDHAAGFRYLLLLMHGDADVITSHEASQQFAQSVGKKCTFKLWPRLYHELYNEPPKQEVIKTLINWLDGIIIVELS